MPSGSRRGGLLALCIALGLAAGGAPSAEAQDAEVRGNVGATAPEFLLEGLEGESIRFPNLGRHRFTVIVFWATWSRYSEAEFELLERLYKTWSGHDVAIVAVNVEASRITSEHRSGIAAWLEQHPVSFPVAVDHNLGAFHAYGVVAVPTTVVVDSQGIIFHRMAGFPVVGADALIGAVEGRLVEQSTGELRAAGPVAGARRLRAIRHSRLGRFLALKGQTEMAEYTLREAIAEDQDLLEPRLELASLQERLGRLEDMQRTLDEAAHVFGDDPRLLLAQGRLRLLQAKPEEAERLARLAFELNPSLGQALVQQARARLALGDGEEQGALALLEQAIEMNRLDLGAMIEMAQILERRGDSQDALQWYGAAYALLDPEWQF